MSKIKITSEMRETAANLCSAMAPRTAEGDADSTDFSVPCAAWGVDVSDRAGAAELARQALWVDVTSEWEGATVAWAEAEAKLREGFTPDGWVNVSA